MNIIQCSMFIFRSLYTLFTFGSAFLACDVVWIGFEAHALCSRALSLSLAPPLPYKHFLPRVFVFVCIFFLAKWILRISELYVHLDLQSLFTRFEAASVNGSHVALKASEKGVLLFVVHARIGIHSHTVLWLIPFCRYHSRTRILTYVCATNDDDRIDDTKHFGLPITHNIITKVISHSMVCRVFCVLESLRELLTGSIKSSRILSESNFFLSFSLLTKAKPEWKCIDRTMNSVLACFFNTFFHPGIDLFLEFAI